MSIWKNFKETDHTFEKYFFAFLLIMALGLFSLYWMHKWLDNIPEVKRLLIDNSTNLLTFVCVFVVVWFLTFSLYRGTLDSYYEYETKATVKVSILNVVIWTCFWIAWAVYCGWLTLHFTPLTSAVRWVIGLLVFIPCLTAFILSYSLRKQDIKDEIEYKTALGESYYTMGPWTRCLDRKYYSGYYALVCIPIYTLILLVGL